MDIRDWRRRMELKEGMYVRTKYGISQYKYYATTSNDELLCIPVKDGSIVDFANIEDILEASYNIIDLIEVGDYINGYKTFEKDDYLWIERLDNHEIPHFTRIDYLDIKSIVTKEQFESMSYKVGD